MENETLIRQAREHAAHMRHTSTRAEWSGNDDQAVDYEMSADIIEGLAQMLEDKVRI